MSGLEKNDLICDMRYLSLFMGPIGQNAGDAQTNLFDLLNTCFLLESENLSENANNKINKFFPKGALHALRVIKFILLLIC